MNKIKRKELVFLLIAIVLLIFLNYNYLDTKIEDFLIDYDSGHVKRIIDGDTIVVDNITIRMLGINTPERGEKYYSEAKEFLEEKILNKTIQISYGKEKTDRYGRTLAYIFYNGKNINLELVEQGYANFYFPSGKDIYYDKFKLAWEECIENNINLCEKSNEICASCVILKEFDYLNQKIVFENICNYNCDLNGWTIKDEGRKKFEFNDFILESNSYVDIVVGEGIDGGSRLFWKDETYVWTSSGDALFLRDDNNLLVLWDSY